VGSLLAIVVPLALGAAVSPTLLGLEVLVLSGRRHPVSRAWAVAVGSALILIAYGVLGLTVLENLDVGRSHRSPTGAAIDLVVAMLLVALALRALRRGKTTAESHQSRTQGRLADAPTAYFVGAGAVGMLVNFSTLLLFLPALHEISHSSVNLAEKGVVGIILVVITLLPVLAPVSLVALLGHRADDPLSHLNAFVSRHSRQITAAIAGLFAVVLLIKGIGELS